MPERIFRVFPRRTKATPDDELSWVGDPGLFPVECDEVHISVAFTYDRPEACRLLLAYRELYPVVKIGGPGMGDAGGDFVPGRYLKPGYIITSRGCPNKCWFCDVWKREGLVRELPITEGWNVLDDNLLACSEKHIAAVFEMLLNQPDRAAFTGGLEAARITPEIAQELKRLNPRPIFTAYDSASRLDHVRKAGEILQAVGFNYEIIRCYVLIGYPGDVFQEAEARLMDTVKAGFMPMAMLYRNAAGEVEQAWKTFQRSWVRPASIKAMLNSVDKQD